MVDSFSRQEARAGLQGVTSLGIGYYIFLLASMLWLGHLSWALLLNRSLSLAVFCWARWRFETQRIHPNQYFRWSLSLGCLGLLSLALSYWLGFNTHVAARITVMIVFSALVGVPWSYYAFYLSACLATCVMLQYWFPSNTDPEVNLAIPIVGLVLSVSMYVSRRRTGRLLFAMSEEVNQRRTVLEQTLAQAQRLGDSLDSDVARATWALQNTNEQLQIAIDEQVQTFELNQKLQRETGEKLRHQALGKAAGAAAHDLNNLLAVISGSLETLEEELTSPSDAEPRQLVEELNQELGRCVHVGREVLALSGRYLLRNDDFELGHWLEQTIAGLPPSLKPEQIRRSPVDQVQAWVRCDQSQLQSAFLKLVRNARESDPDGTIWLSLGVSGSEVCLTIEDQGPGPEARMLQILFEPFSTNKDANRHPGLGLAAARAILRQQGGDVLFLGKTKSGTGARFAIKLPCRSQA